MVLVHNIWMYYVCFQMIMIGTLWRGWSQSTTSLLIHWACPYHWRLLWLVHKFYLGSIFWRGKFDLLKMCTCGKRIYRIDLTEGFHTNPFVGFINNVFEVNLWTHTFILPIFMVFWSDRCKSGDWQRAWYQEFVFLSTSVVRLTWRMVCQSIRLL